MNELLDQTPYSIPDDTHAIDQLAVLIQQEHAIIESARRVRTQLATVARGMSLDSIHRTKEIFESNRIEGIGPDVRRTHEILNTPAADTMADSFDEALFQQSLSKDPDISAVLTLHGARLVANRIRSQIRNGRPLTEVDIRSIHAVICVGEWHAGMYRQFHVKIEKQNHRPPPPDDVPRSMSDLVNWVRTEHDGSTIVKAAVAHA